MFPLCRFLHVPFFFFMYALGVAIFFFPVPACSGYVFMYVFFFFAIYLWPFWLGLSLMLCAFPCIPFVLPVFHLCFLCTCYVLCIDCFEFLFVALYVAVLFLLVTLLYVLGRACSPCRFLSVYL